METLDTSERRLGFSISNGGFSSGSRRAQPTASGTAAPTINPASKKNAICGAKRSAATMDSAKLTCRRVQFNPRPALFRREVVARYHAALHHKLHRFQLPNVRQG